MDFSEKTVEVKGMKIRFSNSVKAPEFMAGVTILAKGLEQGDIELMKKANHWLLSCLEAEPEPNSNVWVKLYDTQQQVAIIKVLEKEIYKPYFLGLAMSLIEPFM